MPRIGGIKLLKARCGAGLWDRREAFVTFSRPSRRIGNNKVVCSLGGAILTVGAVTPWMTGSVVPVVPAIPTGTSCK